MQRPPGVDRESWRAERARFWKKVNRAINVLMLVAIALVLARYMGWLPALG